MRAALKVYNTNHYVRTPSHFRNNRKSAYSVNNITAFFDNADNDNDTVITEFVNEFRKESLYYYNLKTLSIYAPRSVMEGDALRDLLTIRSTYTDLELNLFAFHSPVPGTWVPSGVTLNSLKVTFHDGIAFPNSASDLLVGLDDNKHLQTLCVCNTSPHEPVVHLSRKLKNKEDYHFGVKLQYYRTYRSTISKTHTIVVVPTITS